MFEWIKHVMRKRYKTGINDIDGNPICVGDCVMWADDDEELLVVRVGYGGNMEYAADKKDGTPYAWLDSHCKIISKRLF